MNLEIATKVKQVKIAILDLLIHSIRRLWDTGAVHIGASQRFTHVIGIVQCIPLARILGPADIGYIPVGSFFLCSNQFIRCCGDVYTNIKINLRK